MKTLVRWFLVFPLILQLSAVGVSQSNVDWAIVEHVLGRAGKLQDGVYKVGFPRTDLHVRMGRTAVLPAAALGSWMAFRQEGTGVVADGDLVLLEPEVNGVISSLVKHGIEVSGVHNHLAEEQPKVMYVHFFARGDLEKISQGLKAALAATATPTGPVAPSKAAMTLDRKTLEAEMGKAGTVNGAVLAFSFPRHHAISMHGETLPPSMGMATSINFQPSPAGVAATGDFVLREAEVNPVIIALRKGGVKVTALHNHLLDDNPHTFFVHFWAEGKPEVVAKALRAALDRAP